MPLDLATLRSDAEQFLAELNLEHYLSGAGLKDELATEPIYARHAHLFTREALEAVDAPGPATGDTESRRRGYLRAFLLDGYLEAGVRALSDRITTEMTRATVEIDGAEVPFRRSAVALMNEGDRPRRQAIDQRRDAVRRRSKPLLEQRVHALHQAATGLGYASYAGLYADIRGIDLWGLERMASRFLADTDAVFFPRLRHALAGIGVDPADARRHDAAFLFRASPFDRYFPRDRVAQTLRGTLLGLGIDPDAQAHIILDLEERPNKSPRAFCAPVRVPDRVYLVMAPVGGQGDYGALLHEAGHAQHFGNTSAEEPFEFRCLGDLSVSETYAFLFNHLTLDGHWLETHLGISEGRDWLAFANLEKLHLVRRYCAKLRYELRLHTSGPQGMEQEYAGTLAQATGFQYTGDDYLGDLDDGFYSAQYLRAWALDAMLRKRLTENYGRRWFARREAGDYLRGLWAAGQRPTAEELACQIGYPALDLEAMTQEFGAALGP